MKHFTTYFLAFIILISMTNYAYASTNEDIHIIFNGNNIDLKDKPIIINNRTLIPLRSFFENTDAIVMWNSKNKQAIIQNNDVKIVLPAESDYALVNGNKIQFDTKSKIFNDHIYIPIRFVAETMGYAVNWLQSTKTILINKKNYFSLDNEQDFENVTKVYAYYQNHVKQNVVSFYVDDAPVNASKKVIFNVKSNSKTIELNKNTTKFNPYPLDYSSSFLNINYRDDFYKNIYLTILKDGKILENKHVIKQKKLPLPDSSGMYKFIFNFESENNFLKSVETYIIDLNIKGNESLKLPNFPFRQGDLVPITLTNATDDEYTIKASHLDENFGVYTLNNKVMGVVPIPSTTEDEIITFTLFRKNSQQPITNINLNINKRDFEVQKLTIHKKFKKLKSPKKREIERKKLREAKSKSAEKPYFTKKFLMPIKNYRVTTSFQAKRIVNNGEFTYRHSGIDMAKPAGTPIKCSNDGVVTFATSTSSGGNTVIIDHGIGIFTQYMHMKKINVKKGEKVKRSQIIGEVGSTGYSTGPHLHFDMCKNNFFVDPEQMINFDILKDLEK